MSPLVESGQQLRAWYQHPLVALFVTPFVVPVVMSISSVWLTQARTTDRLSTVETRQEATDARVDADKRERDDKFDELKKTVVTKELLDAKWETVKKIETTTDRLLQIQLDERNK